MLIGRAPTCHVVLANPKVSRQHALVVEVDQGAQVIPLGRLPTLLSGRQIDEPTYATQGDVLEIADSRFTFEITPAERQSAWLVETSGRAFPVQRSGFRVGDGEGNDLRVPGWPSGAVTLFPVVGGLVAEVHPSAVVHGGMRDGDLVQLSSGASIEIAESTVRIALAKDAPATLDLSPAPSEVMVELMPNGALLRLKLETLHTVWLPHKRGDLVAALLAPPTGIVPGDWVPDAALIPRVWGTEGASRVQLNTLIHRTRLSLSTAGLNGPSIIERAKGGGATRARIAKGAAVSVV